MQLCLFSVAYACPYHNPTTTMGHSDVNVVNNKLLAHTTPCTWSAVLRPVGHSANRAEGMAEMEFGTSVVQASNWEESEALRAQHGAIKAWDIISPPITQVHKIFAGFMLFNT